MNDYLTELVYRCCIKDMYPVIQQHKKSLRWVKINFVEADERISVNTFAAVLDYAGSYKRCPGSPAALRAYVIQNPDLVRAYQQSTVIENDTSTLEEYAKPDEDGDTAVNELDDEALVSALLSQTRERWFIANLKQARSLAIGATYITDPATKEKLTGVTTAMQWIRGEFSRDLSRETPAEAGLLHENAASVLRGLEERLQADDTDGRFPLGLPHIDKLVTVGKQGLRYIGVVGMSGDGKTTLTNYITYQWLRQGANVLYVSTEHTPREVWEFMSFLHGSHPDYDFTLPSLRQWDKGEVSVNDQANMGVVLHNIRTRKNLPGLLDVQQFNTWEEIKDHLTTNHPKNRYDCLVVDYIGRLQVPGDQRWRDKAVAGIVHDAQALTRSFDGNKGLIVLTPIQVNREGHKRAKTAGEGEARYDLNAISSISEYQHDLDLCLSVYSDEDMKMGDQCEIQVLKKRKGGQPPVTKMTIDTNSGAFMYLHEPTPPEVRKMWERTADDLVSSTTAVNAEMWE